MLVAIALGNGHVMVRFQLMEALLFTYYLFGIYFGEKGKKLGATTTGQQQVSVALKK